MSSSTSNSEPLRVLWRAMGAGLLIAPVLVAAYFFGPHVARIDYFRAVADKHARLDSLPSPKIIIIGGSNATFGIDSERLERAFCRPVVNMTMNASLGFEFMCNELDGRIGEGDLIIATPEFSAYTEPVKDNETHILIADRAPVALEAMPWYRRPRIHLGLAIMRCQAAWKYATGEWSGPVADKVYRADGFNAQGDLVSHLGLPQRGPDRQHWVNHELPVFDTAILPIAQALKDSVDAHGADLVFTWPAVARSSQRFDHTGTIRGRMAEAGFPLMGRPADYTFPDTAFHDTHYHLRATGRRTRTDRMIQDLAAAGLIQRCDSLRTRP